MMPTKKKPENKTCPKKPVQYSVELADEICDTIASSELGLVHLCNANPHWPHRATIFDWMRKYKDFGDKYARAKEDQTEVTFEYMQELMNEPHKFIDMETGTIKIDVPMLRLKVDTMKWQVGKLKPKKFGDTKPEDINNNAIHDDIVKRKHDLDKKNRREF